MITSVEWNFDDGTQMYTVGIAGIFVSVGVNNSKVVLSGNELTPTDTRTGIPRAIIATNPKRASSYNNIITVLGQSISVEASATEYELIKPTNGALCHSNHFCTPKMLGFEGQPNYTSSIKRLNTANGLTGKTTSPINLKTAESFLADHGDENTGSNNTICRHGDSSVTMFGFAVDLEEGIVELSSGNPCQNPFKKVWQF